MAERHQHEWKRLGYGSAGWSLFRCGTCGTEDIG